MNVSLTPELEKFVQEKLSTGLYRSASEVVREGLRLLYEQEKIREMRRDQLRLLLDEGIESLERGEGVTFDDQLVADVKKSARQRREKR